LPPKILDIAGYPTRAGSPVLQNAPEATAHATVIQQLLDSGGCQLQGKRRFMSWPLA
jgi:amidase